VTVNQPAVPFSQVLNLKRALESLHFRGWGQLYAQTAGTPINPDWPEADRQRAREDLDHAVGGALVVLLFAIFEGDDHWPRDAHHDRYFQSRDKQRFLAFRHIRHSVAHAPDGGRATRHANEFDSVMTSAYRIANVVSWDQDHIKLGPAVGYECLSLMNKIIDDALQVFHDESV